MRGAALIAITVAALVIAPAAAQRTLDVPATARWRHAETGVTLPPRLETMARLKLTDTTDTEADVTIGYESDDHTLLGTVFIFRSALPNAAIWLDRSDVAIRQRDLFAGATPTTPAPVAFVPPFGGAASGLRQTYRTGGGAYRATSVAMIPLDGWLLAIRLSAKTLDPAMLDTAMDRVVAAIGRPAKPVPPQPASTPVADCATPLAFGHAKPVKADMGDALLGSLMGIAAASEQAKQASQPAPVPAATPLCRDPSSTIRYGIYHGEGTGYRMALGDAGRVVDVSLSLSGQIDAGKAGQMLVTLDDVDGTILTFGTFSALPRPAQVMTMIEHGKPIGSRQTRPGRVEFTLPRK
ncbi:hypothetical protein Q5H91_13615 [Sphingomonas sp. KR1UV-12]|uniref:Uncharacterized protein n=1 Tax=Sphingomonas aurea TaxID=3063994 RepID=A0ABT9EMS6_9SPHN|nr:hypothetical protein [Sphingomonas sp. KR1UV-12]MDP1028257.1 hypothetical protein [Sphingomonas sp. KR1UV-12]